MGVIERESSEQFNLELKLSRKLCRREDLPLLEWFGLFSEHAEIIRETFENQERGDALMLLADLEGFPVGQIWVNLALKRSGKRGALWAVRVFPLFQRAGIGAWLMEWAEQLLKERGYRSVELGVEKNNPDARRFYERLGYQVVDTAQGEVVFTTPDGGASQMIIDEWILEKWL